MNADPPDKGPEEELPAPAPEPAEKPQAEEPQAEEPQAEEPQAEEPQAEEPQAEEPMAQEPQAEEPMAEEPMAQEPMAEEPMAEEPQAEAPAPMEAAQEAPAAYAYTPPPAPIAAPARRGRRPLVAVILAIILVVVVLVAYAGIGYAYGQSRIDSARNTYNSAIGDANKFTDTLNGLTAKIIEVDASTTRGDMLNNQTQFKKLTASFQQVQTQIAADDTSLSQAQSDLSSNSWLTLVRKSDIDRYTTKIGHLRNAVSSAKTISADYVQFGTFYQAFYDVLLDLDNLGTQADAPSALAAVAKIKTDSTKAISLDSAPGVAPEVGTFLKDVQKSADDLTALYGAIATGDSAAEAAARAAVDADSTKLDSDDLSGSGAKTDAFYKPLIQAYNKEIDAANNT